MLHVSNDQWKEKIAEDPEAIILDVRTPAEWQEGIIPKARMIDVLDSDNFRQEVKKLDHDKNYFVYCRSGMRSMNACQYLDSLGVKNTYNLLGGITKWDGEKVLP
jgi:rhodanese-related sulfurtransferase